MRGVQPRRMEGERGQVERLDRAEEEVGRKVHLMMIPYGCDPSREVEEGVGGRRIVEVVLVQERKVLVVQRRRVELGRCVMVHLKKGEGEEGLRKVEWELLVLMLVVLLLGLDEMVEELRHWVDRVVEEEVVEEMEEMEEPMVRCLLVYPAEEVVLLHQEVFEVEVLILLVPSLPAEEEEAEEVRLLLLLPLREKVYWVEEGYLGKAKMVLLLLAEEVGHEVELVEMLQKAGEVGEVHPMERCAMVVQVLAVLLLLLLGVQVERLHLAVKVVCRDWC